MSQDLVSLNSEHSCNPESSAENPRNRVCVGVFNLNLETEQETFREKHTVDMKRVSRILTFMPMMMLSHPSAMGACENAETGAATNEGSANWESQQYVWVRSWLDFCI